MSSRSISNGFQSLVLNGDATTHRSPISSASTHASAL
jgi:hypothetical protein